MPHDLLQRDLNVVEAMISICDFLIDNKAKFTMENLEKDEFVLSTACYKIVNLGEEAGKLSDDAVESTRKTVDWHKVRGMRNRLAHEYLEVDVDIIFETIAQYIPTLRKSLAALLKE